MNELLPCPFCGGPNIERVMLGIECADCGARVPDDLTWNRRALLRETAGTPTDAQLAAGAFYPQVSGFVAGADKPCTVCGVPPSQHGSYPTCASHPYTADGNCGHIIGARCVGAECKAGCVRDRATPPAAVPGIPAGYALVPIEPDEAILRPFYDCPPDERRAAWSAALYIANRALAALKDAQ